MSLRCFGKLSNHRLRDQTVSVAEPVQGNRIKF